MREFILVVLAGLVGIGCAATGGGEPERDSLLAERIGVKLAVDRLISSADDPADKAARVCDKARFASAASAELPVQDIAQAILSSLDLESMTPAERAVAVEVVIYIADEINRRVESGVLTSAESVAVEWVARQVLTQAAVYNPAACS